MRGRLRILLGFGAGYVLGAKAGRERYEQLKRLYENLLEHPSVRGAQGKAKEAVGTGFEQAKGLAQDSAHKVTDAVTERRSPDDGGSLSVAPPPS